MILNILKTSASYIRMSSVDIDKVRVIVVGDSGVGKTTLVQLICHGKYVSNPAWTIGCSVDVRLHEYKEGTKAQKTYFVELWDVGGSQSHKNTRHLFYNPLHGIILVHDLTNRKSEQNLRKWLAEVFSRESGNKARNVDDFDPEQFIGSSQVPILVVGTKQDSADEVRTQNQRRSSIAEECGSDEMFLDCASSKAIAPGSSSAVKLARFLDKVIEKKFYGKDRPSPFLDRKKLLPTTWNSKFGYGD